MDLEFKGLQIEIKEITEKGIFKGVASPFNNIDYGNDRVLPSVANKNNGKTVPYLWQHTVSEPIGEVKLTSTNTGIDIEGKLYLDTLENGNPTIPNAYKAYTLMKNNKLKNSIGYKTLDYEYVTEGKKTIRNLKDIDIMEVSAVTFPMNPKANITDVKQEGGTKVDLKEIEEKLNSIIETLKPQQEEKEFSTKIEEMKSLIETKAGAKISKSNKKKLKSTLKAIKELLGEDEEDQDQEEEPEEEQEDKKSKDKEEDKSKEKDRKEPKEEEEEEKEPNKQKKSNNDKIELKADEFEALESLYKNIVHKEDK
ncbi:HK97 family phage prohead protease [Clostridium botulinum]|uniref:HK97 family phage prohead protease n=1 Tax=Clostridium botulinum TaxID=1491 RepID=UPI0007739632|nr:HK97 family phage prohead protease [Clostridium botulinum]